MTPESLAGLSFAPDTFDRLLPAPPAQVQDARGSAEHPQRSLTIAWEDPLATVARAHALTGVEYLRALADGDLPAPPISLLLGFELEEVDEGRVVFGAHPGEHHYNPIGLVHGGLASTLLDSALGCAIHSTLPRGATYSTVELKVNFIRPITRDTGRVRCEGIVVHRGAKIATAEGRVVAERTGKLLAHGTTTCLVSEPVAGAVTPLLAAA